MHQRCDGIYVCVFRSLQCWHDKHLEDIIRFHRTTNLLPWWCMHSGRLVHHLLLLHDLQKIMQKAQKSGQWPAHQDLYRLRSGLAATMHLPVDLAQEAIDTFLQRQAL